MDLEKVHSELHDSFLKAFLFYISQSFFEDDEAAIREMLDYRILDVVILSNSNKEFKDIGNGICSLEVLNKRTLLEQNRFKILDAKEKLEDYQYTTLVNSYITQLNFFTYITDWMYVNLENQYFTVTREQQNAFKLQATLFKNHRDQIYIDITHLNKANGKTHNYDLDNLKKEYKTVFKEIKKVFNRKDDFTKQRIKIKTQKPKKKKLITEQEAEDFLMNTVFNSKK